MPQNENYPWKRYWVKQGENPSVHEGLFVEPDTVTQWLRPASNGVSLLDLQNVPRLVLLGDVGMGKSTTLKGEAREVGPAIGAARTCGKAMNRGLSAGLAVADCWSHLWSVETLMPA